MTRLLSYDDLRGYGIRYSRQHLRRLVKAGKFPKPFQLNPGPTSPLSWTEGQIEKHLEARIAQGAPAAA